MGVFITFEGIDHSGKSTQIELLSQYLQKKHHNVLTLREPGGTNIGNQIRQILLEKSNAKMNDITELLLYEASRSQLIKEVIQPALQNNAIVICDRYIDSTMAYQGYGRGLDKNIIKTLNHIATEGIVPDLTIFLNIDTTQASQRQQQSPDRIESIGDIFMKKVQSGYCEMYQNNNRVVNIDAIQSVEEIQSQILKEVTVCIQNKLK